MQTLTDDTFDATLNTGEPLIVMFTAVFAGPCKAAESTFREARGRRGNQITFAKFDITDDPEIPKRYGVRALPLFMTFKDGKPVEPVAGAVPLDRILEMCDVLTG